jgi:hypothetical protein
VQYALLLPSTRADHAIIILNLTGINVVNFFATVLLTDPSRRAVVLDGYLSGPAPLTNGQCRLISIQHFLLAFFRDQFLELLHDLVPSGHQSFYFIVYAQRTSKACARWDSDSRLSKNRRGNKWGNSAAGFLFSGFEHREYGRLSPFNERGRPCRMHSASHSHPIRHHGV